MRSWSSRPQPAGAFPPGRRARILGAFLFVLGMAAARVPAQAAPADVRALEASASGMRIVVEVPAPRLEPTARDARVSRLALDGYELEGRPGEPELPERVLFVAVPPAGEVRMTVSGEESEARDGVILAARPALERGSEAELRGTAEWPAGDGLEPGAPAPATRPLAELAGVSWMRSQRVARIVVRPARIEVAARRLTVHRRITLVLEFEGGGGEAPAMIAAPDPFENVYAGLLVNYEQGRDWRRPPNQRARTGAAPGARVTPLSASGATAIPDTSLFVGRKWVRIPVERTGFYKIEFRQIRSRSLFVGLTDTPFDSLRLYTLPGEPVLPEDSYCDTCEYRQAALGVLHDESGDGKIKENADAIYFYALGPSDWADFYNPARADSEFINHPYSSRNYYYLTVSTTASPVGVTRNIASESVAVGDPAGTTTPATFAARIHHEIDGEYWPDATPYIGINPDGSYIRSPYDWEKWYWSSVNWSETLPFPGDAPGIDLTQPATLQARVWGLSFLVPTRTKSPGVFDHYLDVSINGVAFPRREWNGLAVQEFDTTLTGGIGAANTLTLSVPPYVDSDPRFRNRVDRVGLAWFNLRYQRRFEPVLNELEFASAPTGGHTIYEVGPFTVGPDSTPHLFDVTDALAPIALSSFTYEQTGPTSHRLRCQRLEPGLRRYRVLPPARIAALATADLVDVQIAPGDNLRSHTRRADVLIVYYDEFRAAADTLLRWRRIHLPLTRSGVGTAPFDTAAVPISAIYDQFSGGRLDPAAVRNFLRAASQWSKVPTFVTFIGDASFDFKNLDGYAAAGQPGSLLPSYEGGYDFGVGRQYATDDWLLNVDDPIVVVPDYFGGRIPAEDANSALVYVRDKLIPYERAPSFGDWRNRVMLIGDDNEQGNRPDDIGWLHMDQTATLDRIDVRPHMDRDYVYLHTYPDGPNDTKPAAKADIIQHFNDGVLLANYIGHGSPFKLSDESVFLDSDASTLVNRSHPAVFVAASCDVGKYNDPRVQSLGERMVLNPNGGAVAVISATELAFSSANFGLNRILYQQLFTRSAGAGQYFMSMAEALLQAKLGGAVNSQKYQVMGDAAVQPALPRLVVDLRLTDEAGAPLTTVQRGQTVRILGDVVDQPGAAVNTAFNGTAQLLIEDSAPIDTVLGCTGPGCVTYPYRAAPMFRGAVDVRSGKLDGRFVAPLNALAGTRAKARAYIEGQEAAIATDGVGSLAFSLVPGTPPGDDQEGPRITLSFPGGSTSVRPDAALRIDLSDVNGILITGHVPQNGIIVTVDGNTTQRYDVTSSFEYAANSYQSGTASFQLPDLGQGPHLIQVGAADNLAQGIAAGLHRSTAQIAFEVSDNPRLSIKRAILFPNPIQSSGPSPGGRFVVDAPGDSVNVLIKIYTVAGKLIRTLKDFGSLGQAQVAWDGLDAEGQPLANGVYLFKVHVNPRDPDGSSSARQQADAEGRIVVVNR